MISLLGPASRPASRFCDGLSRRTFLQAGALGLGGLTMADVLQARADQASTAKAVIMIFLSGGPSHIDTYDMKPDAPDEIRGDFGSIQTNVPGLRICEHMPLQATIADKLAVLRGVKTVGNHTGNEFFSGFAWEQGKPDSVINQTRPALGSVVSKLRTGNNPLPAYVCLHDNPTWEHAYHLGSAHEPFRVFVRQRENQGLDNMRRPLSLSREQVMDRGSLLRSFDAIRRDIDRTGAFDTLDSVNARALEISLSNNVRDAFDINLEPAHVRARYGHGETMFGFKPGQEMLQARRLVEAGVPVVTVASHGWDTHEKNFELLRNQLPVIDRGLHALITDLEVRGMARDVAIIIGGEMGRTPRITRERAGREHWPECGVTLMAGGDFRTGQVVGGSDRRGEYPLGRPITPQMMMASLYRHLGIDPARTFPSAAGRPVYILDERDVIPELF